MKSSTQFCFILLMLVSLLLSGCAAPAAVAPDPTTIPVQVEPTDAPAANAPAETGE
jgi:outer membrane biogenesis lipoprotein LolB